MCGHCLHTFILFHYLFDHCEYQSVFNEFSNQFNCTSNSLTISKCAHFCMFKYKWKTLMRNTLGNTGNETDYKIHFARIIIQKYSLQGIKTNKIKYKCNVLLFYKYPHIMEAIDSNSHIQSSHSYIVFNFTMFTVI